jgi:hypothetical protein
MSDNDCFAWVIGCATAVFICIATCITVYNMHQNTKIAEALKNGGDPIAIGCAFGNLNNNQNYNVCAMIAQKREPVR